LGGKKKKLAIKVWEASARQGGEEFGDEKGKEPHLHSFTVRGWERRRRITSDLHTWKLKRERAELTQCELQKPGRTTQPIRTGLGFGNSAGTVSPSRGDKKKDEKG